MPAAFTAALRQAVRAAAGGAIVVLGIRPDRPDTGYGYIRAARRAAATAPSTVAAFVEKPDLATAERYLADGGYFWNSGMFVLRASVWLAALGASAPTSPAASEAAWRTATTDAAFLRFDTAAFAAIPADSIDYAVMEPASRAGRRDSTSAWCRSMPAGATSAPGTRSGRSASTTATATPRTATRWCATARNTLVHATSRLVGVIGLDDVIVVETADAVLVAHRSKSQDVKELVAALGRDRPQRSEHAIAACTGPGAGTKRSTRGRASRSSASWSSRARASACRCITTAPSTGSSSRAPRR